MIIVQLTDTHLRAMPADDGLASRRAANLRRCVANINQLDPSPDVVIHTGDLADEGEPETYALARDIMGELVPPFYPIPGNCDNRAALSEWFGDRVPAPGRGGFVQYAVDDFPVRLVGVDTKGNIGHDGDYDDERAGALEALLGADSEKPTVLFMHHAPVAMGPEPSAFRLRAVAERLAAQIARHPQVVRLFCGHHHAPLSGAVGPVLGTSAPATSIDRRDGPFPEAMDDTPVYEVHLFDGDRGFISYTCIVAA